MSKRFKKATRPARAPRRTFRVLSRSVNEALSQVAAELDAMRRVVAAVIRTADVDAGVRKLLGMPPVDTSQPGHEHDACSLATCRNEASPNGGTGCPIRGIRETAQAT